MKVHELINELKNCNPNGNIKIVLTNEHDEYCEVVPKNVRINIFDGD